MNDQTQYNTPLWKLVLGWIIVSVPLIWGVIQTIEKSLPLFMQTP